MSEIAPIRRASRGRSLFWLIAGAVLCSAAIGTLLQALVVLAVVRPIEAREARARAELAVNGIASAFASALVMPEGAELDSLLRHHRELSSIRPSVIVARMRDGSVATSPSDFVRVLPRVLQSDSLARAGANAWPRAGDAAQGDGRPPTRNEILARHTLSHGNRVVGEVEVMRRSPRGPSPDRDPLAPLLYLPIAVLVSGAVSLVLVRMLVRRLHALEQLAARVAAGDLSGRLADPSGDEIGRVATQFDRMTERLAVTRSELEAQERQRRQLFADITHELATPLTSIRGAAETLLDPQVPMTEDARARYLRGVLDESRRLDRLIRDLFELARLEAGATTLTLERLDWTALCRNTLERFEPRYQRAGLTLEWKGDGGEAWVEADGLRIEQVIDNLLVNALRYVPEGGHVALALERVNEPAPRFRLTVSDDGPGVPPELLPLLFERFYRASAGPGESPGARNSRAAQDTRGAEDAGERVGSGLGLAIVREIIERHGGAVRARAMAPHGLAIEIELPARG